MRLVLRLLFLASIEAAALLKMITLQGLWYCSLNFFCHKSKHFTHPVSIPQPIEIGGWLLFSLAFNFSFTSYFHISVKQFKGLKYLQSPK